MEHYIKIEEAIKAIKHLKGNCDSRFYDEALIDAQSELLELRVEAIPQIVRCRDCRFQSCYEFGGDTLVCENPIKGLFNNVVYENDFCSYAERRQEE